MRHIPKICQVNEEISRRNKDLFDDIYLSGAYNLFKNWPYLRYKLVCIGFV